jgi:hypothetical protein
VFVTNELECGVSFSPRGMAGGADVFHQIALSGQLSTLLQKKRIVSRRNLQNCGGVLGSVTKTQN